ncbi:glucose-6-phosphate isomerase [Lysobacter pythonis]|uniref:Glucose-6-phosphate isomerase n=1 Tax=Solilutibacter pythonis TaxID=2483112 RepID=A0A3M2HVF0_9GAMM|nr:glucose-6-phosphate isomerase [Lysobacter pythonis]RMH93008.1 glucose-6-phosphate isomerase [Lysobacter pythonis]
MPIRLREQAARLEKCSLREMVAADPARARDFALRVGPLYANFARQSYDREALAALFALAREVRLPAAMRRLADGASVNGTEGRAALHTALRDALPSAVIERMAAQYPDPAATAACAVLRDGLSATGEARAARAAAAEARARMAGMIGALFESEVVDIVSIGIGGSDLGPRMLVDALAQPGARFRVHFLSNVDGAAAQRVLDGLDPRRTAAILVSKSFGTRETLLNGRIVADWLGDDGRLYAVSANGERAAAFGIPPERTLPMWDWVGGRYSLWSAVGFPVALAIGLERFEALLAGAALMDAHALRAAPETNLAYWHALSAIWNRNALRAASQAVLPYEERLRLLPAYLQQLVMESLGKRTRLDGGEVEVDTVPVWWGGVGSDCQHSYFQALHQGTQKVPVDFIGVLRPDHDHPANHVALLSNLLAQGEALANGEEGADPHRHHPGNRPSTLLLLDALTPTALGMLLALYEHSVYLQSVIWGINAFDQFGVELGKQLADRLLPALAGEAEADDTVTRALLAEIAARR